MDGVENRFIIPELYLDSIKQTIDETHLKHSQKSLDNQRYNNPPLGIELNPMQGTYHSSDQVKSEAREVAAHTL